MNTSTLPAVIFHPFREGDESISHLDGAGQIAHLNVAVFDCANLNEVLLKGWSTIEDGYVWSCEREATFRISLPNPQTPCRMRLVVDSFRSEDALPSQRVIISLNDQLLGEVTINAFGVLDCGLPLLDKPGDSIVRLQFPDAKRPKDLDRNNADDRLLGLSLRRVVVCQEVEAGATGAQPGVCRPVRTPLAESEKAELITRFESLGENCEFGLLQRRCGAEPLGLLRFSSAPLQKLVAALRARFEGMGKAENIEVELSSNGLEYMVRDRAFGFYYHAWVKAGEMTPQQIQAREKARVPFLLRKLFEDLEAGEKIFVFHAMSEISDASAHLLSQAVRSYGPGRVLWVRQADSRHPPGHVEELSDSLIAGYIDRFAPGNDAYNLSLDCWIELCRAITEPSPSPTQNALVDVAPAAPPKQSVKLVPPHALLMKWLDSCGVPGSEQMRAPYDDVLDVFRAMLAVIPVNEEWYVNEYPELARIVGDRGGETASVHFLKHGYFEGRRPFAAGWHGLQEPLPFKELIKSIRIVVGRGCLLTEFAQEQFIEAIKHLLMCVSVDADWYLKFYPDAASDIQVGQYRTAADHYAQKGYFKGLLPNDIDVDADWYVARYAHVRTGLAEGVAGSAKDHFMRIGYGEGCQPSL